MNSRLYLDYDIGETRGIAANVQYYLEYIFKPSIGSEELSRDKTGDKIIVELGLHRNLSRDEMQQISNHLLTTFNITSTFEGYSDYLK